MQVFNEKHFFAVIHAQQLALQRSHHTSRVSIILVLTLHSSFVKILPLYTENVNAKDFTIFY